MKGVESVEQLSAEESVFVCLRGSQPATGCGEQVLIPRDQD